MRGERGREGGGDSVIDDAALLEEALVAISYLDKLPSFVLSSRR